MRKSSFCLGLIFALAITVKANAQFTVGFYGGANISAFGGPVRDDPTRQNSAGVNANLGVLLDYNFSKKFALRLNASYARKDANSQSVNGLLAGSDFTPSIKAIDIPLFLKYNLGTMFFRPYVMAGPTLSFIRDANVTSNVSVVNGVNLNPINRDTNDEIERLDFGFGLGIGLALSLGRGSLFFETRYLRGLRDLYKSENIGFISGIGNLDDIDNMSNIQFVGGLTFALGRFY